MPKSAPARDLRQDPTQPVNVRRHPREGQMVERLTDLPGSHQLTKTDIIKRHSRRVEALHDPASPIRQIMSKGEVIADARETSLESKQTNTSEVLNVTFNAETGVFAELTHLLEKHQLKESLAILQIIKAEMERIFCANNNTAEPTTNNLQRLRSLLQNALSLLPNLTGTRTTIKQRAMEAAEINTILPSPYTEAALAISQGDTTEENLRLLQQMYAELLEINVFFRAFRSALAQELVENSASLDEESLEDLAALTTEKGFLQSMAGNKKNSTESTPSIFTIVKQLEATHPKKIAKFKGRILPSKTANADIDNLHLGSTGGRTPIHIEARHTEHHWKLIGRNRHRSSDVALRRPKGKVKVVIDPHHPEREHGADITLMHEDADQGATLTVVRFTSPSELFQPPNTSNLQGIAAYSVTYQGPAADKYHVGEPANRFAAPRHQISVGGDTHTILADRTLVVEIGGNHFQPLSAGEVNISLL